MKLKTKFMVLMLLMVAVGQKAWAAIGSSYNSATSTLVYEGSGNDELTASKVKSANGYGVAKHIKIGSGIKSIAAEAFRSDSWTVDDIEFCWSQDDSKLHVGRQALDFLNVTTFICSRDFEFEYHDGSVGNEPRLTYGLFRTVPRVVKVNNLVTTIPAYAFYSTVGGMSEVDFSNATRLKSIEKCAFYWPNYTSNNVKNVSIPASVVSIGEQAFYMFVKEKVIFENSTTPIKVSKGAFVGAKSFECYRPVDGEYMFNFSELSKNETLWNVVLGGNATSVKGIYWCTALKNLTIENNKIFTNNYTTDANLGDMFNYVETLTLGANVTKVSNNAFYDTYSLKTLNVQGSNTLALGEGAFVNCPNLKTVNGVSDGDDNWMAIYKQIGVNFSEYTFGAWSQNKTWTATNNLYTMFPNLVKITFTDWVISIGAYTYYCPTGKTSKLSEIVFKETVDVGNYAFANNKKLTKITGNMLTIGQYSFNSCVSLPSVDFASCKSIGANAFAGCTTFGSLIIPQGMTSIASTSFSGDQSLKYAEVHSPTLLNSSNLYGKLGGYVEYLVVNASKIGSAAFKDAANLKMLFVYGTVTEIAADAFAGTTKLTDVIFYEPDLAEKNWSEDNNLATRFPYLERLSLPNATKVGIHAFSGSKTLKSVNGVVEPYAKYCFANCPNLEGLDVSCVEGSTIAPYSFYNCKKLTDIKIESVWAIEDHAFYGAGLKELELPADCEVILGEAFYGCPLTHVISHNTYVPEFWEGNAFEESIIKQNKTALDVPAESLTAYQNDEYWSVFFDVLPIGGVRLVDGEPYNNDEKQENINMLKYTRTFSEKTANNWQCLYVPFDITVTDELLDDFDFAKLYMVSYKDVNKNGEIEDDEPLVMLLMKQSAGKVLRANTPYFIKAKEAGTKSIVVKNATLEPAMVGSVRCSTTEHEYTLCGNYNTVNIIGNYTLNTSGQLSYYTQNQHLKPNRWYMEVNGVEDGDLTVEEARPIMIIVDGEDDTTGLMDICSSDKIARNDIYTLDGRKVSDSQNLRRGIYLINGKKVFVK